MSHLAAYNNQGVLAKYLAWDALNPDFYREFVKYTKALADRGHRRISVALVFERIRWESLLQTQGDEFNVNNNFKPVYARRFMDDHPQYGEIFELRTVH